ncbi:hypothetical protein RhiJN_28290 [Ceratobasidium sp. AG-Ba]|nr:hypothetical protein RhiJN_28290 [Ceratobasidium sp. AG-Ba]
MSYIPYHVDPRFSHVVENTFCVESYPPLQPPQPPPIFNELPFDPVLLQTAPLQTSLSESSWPSSDHSPWDSQLSVPSTWDTLSSFASPSSSEPNCDPFTQMQMLGYDANPDYEAYSPPSTATSDLELPPFDTMSSVPGGLPATPVVPSSNREVPLVHARLRIRKSNKESSKRVCTLMRAQGAAKPFAGPMLERDIGANNPSASGYTTLKHLRPSLDDEFRPRESLLYANFAVSVEWLSRDYVML